MVGKNYEFVIAILWHCHRNIALLLTFFSIFLKKFQESNIDLDHLVLLFYVRYIHSLVVMFKLFNFQFLCILYCIYPVSCISYILYILYPVYPVSCISCILYPVYPVSCISCILYSAVFYIATLQHGLSYLKLLGSVFLLKISICWSISCFQYTGIYILKLSFIQFSEDFRYISTLRY